MSVVEMFGFSFSPNYLHFVEISV